ncbi:MAG: hypothetical protein IT424_03870 [Pirellulales bacterium]|nr:hypothetical protein [Pirellulales bacterium]
MAAALPLLAHAINIPAPWLVVWALLALFTVGLAVLLRTRLHRLKPWHKCAILSLWVHVLLGCLIGAVRIATGGPGLGDGYGPPIQVALLPAEGEAAVPPANLLEQPPVAQPIEAPDDPPAAPTTANESEQPQSAEQAPPSQPLAPPELLAAAEPPAAPPEVADPPPPDDLEPPDVAPPDDQAPSDQPPEPNEIADDPSDRPPLDPAPHQSAPLADAAPPQTAPPAPDDHEQPRVAAAPSDAQRPSGIAQTAAEPTPPSAAAPPSTYAARFAPNRLAIAESGGGGANTERAVAAGLAWLAANQEPDGRWDPRRHGAGQERFVLDQDRGAAGAKADTGISALALLAFLGAGHAHRDGPYALTVGQGLEYLRHAQRHDGNLCGDAELFARMYCHSMASFALAEACALSRDQRLLPAVRAAAGYSLAVQHPSDGGWRYRPGDTGDTSQLGWQVMALRSAEQGGVQIPAVTWTRVDRFLRQVVRGRAGGLAVYRPEEARPSRAMTAEALYCRQLATGRADGDLAAAALAEAIGSLVEEPPSQRAVNLYYWYYATLALHRAQHVSPQAAAAWRTWNDALTQTLLATQRPDGSWPATCLWGGYGGRVYATALATMCLEVYYRYAPPADAPAPEHISSGPLPLAGRAGEGGSAPYPR